MNLKQIFGPLLTILGIVGLIYGAFLFLEEGNDWRMILVSFVLGLIFFSSGLGLIKGTHDST